MAQNRDRVRLPASISAVLAMLTMTAYAFAQSDTITQNPNAKPFNRIWSIAGNGAGGDLVGEGIGGIPDLNGDGINEFAVCYGGAAQWRIFYGAENGNISHTPALILDSLGPPPTHPVTGHFWGDERRAVVFTRGVRDTLTIEGNLIDYVFPLYLFFRADSNRLDTVPAFVIDSRKMTPRTVLGAVDAVAKDLDGDGADELIMAHLGVSRGGVRAKGGEVWIYRGGPNFQVDTPTVILRDDSTGGAIEGLYVGRWDSDGKPDIAVGFDYSAAQRVKFWFSDEGSPWDWTTPSRSVQFGGFVALDADGDSVFDMGFKLPDWRVGVFLSSAGKSYHDRTLTMDDIDMRYHRYGFHNPVRLGYVSDSTARYEMLGIVGADDGGPTTMLGFSGGPNGPDRAWDVYDYGGPYSLAEPIGDVTGDGWNDLLQSYAASGFNAGIAVLYAGGPYIPRDTSLGVEYVTPVTGVRRDAVSIWPIPARDELHIAWRGDLSRMPSRFAIHDVLGRLVARGDVESWRGEALWRCAGVASGAYFLTVYDAGGTVIATSRLLKE